MIDLSGNTRGLREALANFTFRTPSAAKVTTRRVGDLRAATEMLAEISSRKEKLAVQQFTRRSGAITLGISLADKSSQIQIW